MKTREFKIKRACILAAAAMAFCAGCQKESVSSAVPAAGTDLATNNVATASAEPRPEFKKLTGNWLRPDGGYVLEIKSVASSGQLEVAYLNPNPIHVSKALALQEGTTTKVFVELQDVNYPGCTYSLTYDPQTDQLYGQYYQAALQQRFDVAFGRIKE